MNQKEEIINDFNVIAQLSQSKWEHNKHYHKFLLRFVPKRMGKALDIGCGTGEFTRALAEQTQDVTGIDLSPEMIKQAKALSSKHPNIKYEVADILEYDLGHENYDCIASIATFHHLQMEEMFDRIKTSLRTGGVLLILDLYKQTSIVEYILSAIAIPVNILVMVTKTGRLKKTKEEIEAWKEHDKHDKFMTFSEICRIANKKLPGVKLRRHFFWRYSLAWEKKV